MHPRRFLLQAVVVLLAGSAAQATLLTFHFEGKVTQVRDSANVLGGSVLVGESFKGSYTFDSVTHLT